MKSLTAVIVICFCLIAIFPTPITANIQERKGSCNMSEQSGSNGRMSCCQTTTAMHPCGCSTTTHNKVAFPLTPSSCGCASLMTTLAQPTTLLERIRRYALGGYRRVTGKNLMEHESRRDIYEKIVATPGIDLRTLTRITGINENTLRYHIERMEAGGKIQIANIGGLSHFFENHGRYSEEEQILKARMFTTGSCRILQVIQHNPGITRGELADRLGVAGPTVTRGMMHLVDEGLIRQVRDGRYARYFPERILMGETGHKVQSMNRGSASTAMEKPTAG